jgi:hypothetical protein
MAKLSPRKQAAAAKAKAKAKAAKNVAARQREKARLYTLEARSTEGANTNLDLGLGLALIGFGGLAVYAAYKMWTEIDEEDKPAMLTSSAPPAKAAVPAPSTPGSTFGTVEADMLPTSFYAPATGTFDIVQVYDFATGAWVGSPEALAMPPEAFDALNASDPATYAANYAAQAVAQGCKTLGALLSSPPGSPKSKKFVFRWGTRDGVVSNYAALYSNCTDGRMVKI